MINFYELRELVNTRTGRAHPLALEFEAFSYSPNTQFGVIVKTNSIEPLNLHFSSVRLENIVLNIKNVSGNYFYLSCSNDNYLDKFILLCLDFLKKENQIVLQTNPKGWWKDWSEFIGNTLINDYSYPILSEFYIYCNLFKIPNLNVTWEKNERSSHDITTTKFDIEVKSSIHRDSNEISISSEYQLTSETNKDLYLFFLIWEPDENGKYSIKNLLNSYSNPDRGFLLDKLNKRGITEGDNKFGQSYRLHMERVYLVDNNFPKILSRDIRALSNGNHFSKFSYTINLTGIKTINIDWSTL